MERKVLYVLSCVLLLTAAILWYVFLYPLAGPLILHFDRYRGIDLWGGRFDVLGLIILGAAVNILNYGLAWTLSRRETGFPKNFFSNLTAGINLFFSLLILISVGVIISVN